MLRGKRFLFTCLILMIFTVFAGVADLRAQSISGGKLTGTITDDKGEPLPGVAVEVTSPALISGKRATTTTARGTYVFLDLPVGRYTLTASIPSFKTAVQENIVISVGASLSLDLIMQVGAIEETITVTAAGPIVDTKTSGIDSKLERAMLEKLPTSRDAFYDLSLTAPGMFGVGSTGSWQPSPTAYGGSSMENVFLVNGVNTTAPRGAAFGPLINVNYNAVEEVRIIALGSKAEYGSFSGAAIDVLTRSGSNAFHGNAAYYTQLGGKFFKANQPPSGDLKGSDWLYVQRGDVLTEDVKSSWELDFTLGGPIIKDKVWFYGAFDYVKSETLPVNWSLLNTYTGRYADIKISAEPFMNHRAWMSYHFESNQGRGWSWGSEPEWDTAMNYGSDTANNTISAQWQWLPTSSIIFTGKYLGFWTNDLPVLPEDAAGHPGYINWWKWNTQYGIEGAFPYIEAQKSTRQTIQADMSYYAEDFLGEHDIKFGVQYSMGRGNWLGGYFQGYANFAYPLGGWWGYVAGKGYAIADLKAHTWYNYGGITMNDGLMFYNNRDQLNPFETVRTADSLGFFFDDQWSPSRRLTFNIGLRYDRMTTKYGKGITYDFLTKPEDIKGDLKVLATGNGSENIFDFKTFSPRLGLTYQLTNDGKTVLRASYGRFYMPLAVEFLRRFGPDTPNMLETRQIFLIPWDEADPNHDGYIDIFGVNGLNELQYNVRKLPGLTPISESTTSANRAYQLNVADNVKDMSTDQFSVSIERELVKDFSLSATYIYKHSANLFVNVPINSVTGLEWEYETFPFQTQSGETVQLYSILWKDYNGDGAVDGQDVTWIGDNNDVRVENMRSYGGKKPQRTYQGLQFVLNKRLSNRWQGMASLVYSWSNGTAQRTMRQSDNMMGPMLTDDTWMGNVNYTINNMSGALPFVPKFELKASGSYRVPVIELDLGIRFRWHSGRPIWKVESYPTRTAGGGIPGSVITPGGVNRIVSSSEPDWMPAVSVTDLRLEKSIPIRNIGSLIFVIDAFNIFNTADVTNVDWSGQWGRITGITDARRVRLSFMFQF